MTKILGISGSLRRESVNRRLLTAARHALPDGVALHTWDGLASLPLFDEDAETPPPEAVARLRESIVAADALLIATPEYNGSIPGVLKNAVDWASRPHGEGALVGKPVAVVGASPAPYGAAWAQAELRKVLGITGAVLATEAELAVGEAHLKFDEHGRLLDASLRQGLAALLTELHDAAGNQAAA